MAAASRRCTGSPDAPVRPGGRLTSPVSHLEAIPVTVHGGGGVREHTLRPAEPEVRNQVEDPHPRSGFTSSTSTSGIAAA